MKHYDVIVIGGGTAGTVAAVAAAREGKSVLICEREYALGGTSTLALTTPRMSNHMSQEVTNSSIATELKNDINEHGDGYGIQWFNPVMLPLHLERICVKYGVKILYGMCYVGCSVQNGDISSVTFRAAEGVVTLTASRYIDATGNAAVALDAGCETESGNDEGVNQPMTLRFAIGNVDIPKAKRFMNGIGVWADEKSPTFEIASTWKTPEAPLTKLFSQAVDDGVLEKRDGNYFQAFACDFCQQGVLWCNCPEAGHIRDANTSEGLTELVLYSREAASRLTEFLRKYVGGFENCCIHSYASMPGIRESRRLVGRYYLTEQDFNERKKTDDCVAQTAYPIDVHDAKNLRLQRMERGEYYEIPYECMLPKTIGNLLVAGRCISASFVAQSSMRIQLVCMALGEAAGIAAASGKELSHISGREIREKMISYGGTFA